MSLHRTKIDAAFPTARIRSNRTAPSKTPLPTEKSTSDAMKATSRYEMANEKIFESESSFLISQKFWQSEPHTLKAVAPEKK